MLFLNAKQRHEGKLRITASDYPFGIFNFSEAVMVNHHQSEQLPLSLNHATQQDLDRWR